MGVALINLQLLSGRPALLQQRHLTFHMVGEDSSVALACRALSVFLNYVDSASALHFLDRL